MPNLQRFNNGESPLPSAKLNLIVDALTGSANTPINHSGVNDAINYALTVRNQDLAGKAAIIYAPDGLTVLLQVTAAGVQASPDGLAAAAPLVTTTSTQTLTNKTLTSPVLNGTLTGTAGFGAATTFAPTLTQGSAVTLSTANGRYIQQGKIVHAWLHLTASAGGTAANAIVVGGLPVAARSTADGSPGAGTLVRAAAIFDSFVCNWNSATSVLLIGSRSTTGQEGVSPAVTIAAGDTLDLFLAYEVP